MKRIKHVQRNSTTPVHTYYTSRFARVLMEVYHKILILKKPKSVKNIY